MARSKYYDLPKKPFNPRAVHLYDIAAMILVFAIALTLMPIGTTVDFSAGFNQKSEAYLQEEYMDLVSVFEEGDTSSGAFRTLFMTSCLQNSGYVYETRDGYYFYKNGEQGMGYYLMDDEGNMERADKQEGDNPLGLIIDGVCLSVMENGQIFIDDLDGKSGLMDAYVDLDAEIDYAEVAKIMLSSEISYRDAAMLWHLIQQEIIIGFDGDAVWFQEASDGIHRIYRATEYEVEEKLCWEAEMWDVMVIDDRYLIHAEAGNLYIYCLETGDAVYMPFDEWTELGELLQLAYRVNVNGKIRIYALNSQKPSYYDLSGNGVEMDQMVRMDGVNGEKVYGLYPTGIYDTIIVWFREAGQYTHITQ